MPKEEKELKEVKRAFVQADDLDDEDEGDEGKTLDEMSIKELKAVAKEKEIDIKGLKKKDDIIEAMKAGVNNYVVKPFTPETLKAKIDAVLGK